MSEEEVGGFFSFRTMISPHLIKIIYVLGMMGLSIIGFGMIVYAEPAAMWMGPAVIVLGNLLWRIFCEGLILLFSMHDILGSIDKELKRK